MKNITAIIRINKINETKKALTAIGLPSFMATDRAMGRGKGNIDEKVLDGAKKGHPEALALLGETPPLHPKRIINLIVPTDRVDEVVEKLIEVNQTGNPGDGKIFISPVYDAIRVRTGETGYDVI